MSDTFLISLISIVGVLLSGTASFIVARLQNKAALEKIKKELEQQYAKSLFDKRVETYQELYNILSDYSKILEYKQYNVENLNELRNKIDKWNSQNAIFFSHWATKLSWRFRGYLNSLLSQATNSNSRIKKDGWVTIAKAIRIFEATLKAEIGVYEIKPVGQPEGLDEICEELDKKRGYTDWLNTLGDESEEDNSKTITNV